MAASKIGVFSVSPTIASEIATLMAVTDGPTVTLKNLGSGTVWITQTLSGESAYEPGWANAWPLAPDEQTVLTLPAYPVAMDTWVPGVLTDGPDCRVAYISHPEG